MNLSLYYYPCCKDVKLSLRKNNICHTFFNFVYNVVTDLALYWNEKQVLGRHTSIYKRSYGPKVQSSAGW